LLNNDTNPQPDGGAVKHWLGFGTPAQRRFIAGRLHALSYALLAAALELQQLAETLGGNQPGNTTADGEHVRRR
jgi:hypothetical protein